MVVISRLKYRDLVYCTLCFSGLAVIAMAYRNFSDFANGAEAVSHMRSTAQELWRFRDRFHVLPISDHAEQLDWRDELIRKRIHTRDDEERKTWLSKSQLARIKAVLNSDGEWYCRVDGKFSGMRAMLIAFPESPRNVGDIQIDLEKVQFSWSVSTIPMSITKLRGAIICSYSGEIRTIPENAGVNNICELLSGAP